MIKALIADDDFTIGMQIEEMLTVIGYDVVGQAGSGQEAFEMARDFRPDIILMDIVMPGELNGIKAAEKIKAEWDVPIVFISGHGESDLIQEAKQIEPYGYVMKPFDETEIKASIEIALHKHKMEMQLKQAHAQLERTNLVLQMEIEARKKIEGALLESEEKFRVIFERSIQGILVVDLETKRFAYANPSICRMFGYSEAEFLQMGVSNIHPKDSLDHVMSEFDIQRRGEKEVAAGLSCLRKNGTVFYADITATGIIINHRECVVGFFADISERKQAEEALREGEEKYKRLVENAVVGVYQVTEDGSFRFVNEKMAQIFGYDNQRGLLEEVANIADLYASAEERPAVLREMDENGFIHGKEMEFKKKDGCSVWVALFTRKIRDRGKILYEGLMEDITERKQIEAQLQLIRFRLTSI